MSTWITMWVLQTTPLENSVWSGSPNQNTTNEDPPMTYTYAILVLCRLGRASASSISASSISSLVVPDDIPRSRFTIVFPVAFASTLSSPSELPNPVVTTSCLLWPATLKLPMELVGKGLEELPLGCAMLFWRSRWKRQIMITARLHVFS